MPPVTRIRPLPMEMLRFVRLRLAVPVLEAVPTMVPEMWMVEPMVSSKALTTVMS